VPVDPIARVYVDAQVLAAGARGCVLVEGEGGGVRRVRHGLREELGPGGLRRAALRFASQPEWVFHDAQGWHYFSATNRWRSASFLGEIEQVTLVPRGRVGRGPGRAVAIEEGAIAGMGVPGVVVDAAFRDAAQGLAVVEPGAVLATGDGGATWRHVPLPEVATEVIATPQASFVVTRRGAWRYDGTGFVAASLDRSTPCPEEDSPDWGLAQLAREVPDVAPTSTRWLDAAHTRALNVSTGAVFNLVDERDEERLGPPCETWEFVDGSATLALCGESPGEVTLRRRERGDAWRDVATLRDCGGRCVASPDDARVVCEGRCDPRAECDGVATVCEVAPDGRKTERRVGDLRRSFRPVGFDGDAAVLVDDRAFLAHKEFIRGEGPPQRLCPGLRSTTLRWNRQAQPSLRLGRDGHLRLDVVGGASVRSSLLDVEPGVRCEEVAEPPGASEATMRWCGPDGRALGFAGSALWRLQGEGAGAWVRLGGGPEGDVELGPFGRPSYDQTDCNEAGLWSRATGEWILGWGPIRTLQRRQIGWREGWDLVRVPQDAAPWRCAVETMPLPRRSPAEPPMGLEREPLVLGASALWVAVPGPEGDRPGIAWTRHDRRGFTLAFDQDPLLPLRSGDGAWLMSADSGRERFTFWRVSAHVPAVRRVETPGRPGGASDVLFTAAGPVFAMMWREEVAARDRSRLQVVRWEGARRDAGEVALSHVASTPVVLYVRRGEAGVARYLPDGSLLGAAPGRAPRVVAAPGAVAVCGASAEDAATGVFLVRTPDVPLAEDIQVHLDFAFEGDRLCLRGSRDPNHVARFEGASLLVHREREGRLLRLTCGTSPTASPR
jgi:hypothetical protein